MLTARQQEIWGIPRRVRRPPRLPADGAGDRRAVGLASPSTVHAHLANLERAGLLRRDPTKPRALELSGTAGAQPCRRARPRATMLPRLPLLGQVAAGGPLLAEENVEDDVAVPEPLGRGADFLLRVKGDSMIDAGILDGDTLVVQRHHDARNGEIVVALAGDDESADEATVKRFFRDATAASACSRRTPRSSPSTPTTSRSSAACRGVPEPLMARRVPHPHARPGARRARPRRQPGVPGLRRVHAAPPRAIACPECGTLLATARRTGARAPGGLRRGLVGLDCVGPAMAAPAVSATVNRRRPGDRGRRGRPRKVRTPQGRTLGKPQAAKADGKWNREETAGGRFRR